MKNAFIQIFMNGSIQNNLFMNDIYWMWYEASFNLMCGAKARIYDVAVSVNETFAYGVTWLQSSLGLLWSQARATNMLAWICVLRKNGKNHPAHI